MEEHALLAAHGAWELLAELERWEHLRASLRPTRYTAPGLSRAKTLVLLDGIPGAGKSTTQRWLQPVLGAGYRSMARFAESRGVTAEARQHAQLSTARPHPVDEAFLHELASTPELYVLVEKFPRSVVEATALLETAARQRWRLEVLNLRLPGDSISLSVQRQLDRGARHGRVPEVTHASHRALVHLARATSGREVLRAAGVPIHRIDATADPAMTVQTIRAALGVSFQHLSWHWPTLRTLEQATRLAGLDGTWLVGGSFYRPFWNDRFGPRQRPTDLDVAVDSPQDAEALRPWLHRLAPHERWSVLAPSQRLLERHGLRVPDAPTAKTYATFLHRTGLVRLTGGSLDVRVTPQCEAALWNGVVALNPKLLEAVDAEHRARILSKDTHHLPRALEDYPGLDVDPALRETPGWREHQPADVMTSFEAAKGPVVSVPMTGLSLREGQLVSLHLSTPWHPSAPRLPLPLRSAHETFETIALYENDDAFADWFRAQTSHHAPPGGKDGETHALLDFQRLGLRETRADQGPLHQGWSVRRHLIQSVLELSTDTIVARFSSSHSAQWCFQLRRALRVAMLHHDLGKLVPRRKEGRHAAMSAALSRRLTPAWLTPSWRTVVERLITVHDVFGRVARRITEPLHGRAYGAGLTSAEACSMLATVGLTFTEAVTIAKALWLADLGSIAALRWLAPTAEVVEAMLLDHAPGIVSKPGSDVSTW